MWSAALVHINEEEGAVWASRVQFAFLHKSLLFETLMLGIAIAEKSFGSLTRLDGIVG